MGTYIESIYQVGKCDKCGHFDWHYRDENNEETDNTYLAVAWVSANGGTTLCVRCHDKAGEAYNPGTQEEMLERLSECAAVALRKYREMRDAFYFSLGCSDNRYQQDTPLALEQYNGCYSREKEAFAALILAYRAVAPFLGELKK